MFNKVVPAAGNPYDVPMIIRHGSRYVANDSCRTMSELLADDPKLLPYAEQLDNAELNAQLVSELSLSELRELLNNAPIAHCLELRQRMVASAKLRPVIPDAPAWKWQARQVANGMCDGNLKQVAEGQHNCDLVVGSLFLSFVIGPVLAPPTECGDGSACSGLLAADILCWVCLTTCLMLGVVNSWTMVSIERCVSTNCMPHWMCDNWRIYQLGPALMVASFTFLPAALSTRSIILLCSPSYPSWLVWVVVGILIGGGVLLQYTWWVVICSRTFTITSLPQFVAFNLGTLGLRTPTEQLEKAPVQDPVSYMD